MKMKESGGTKHDLGKNRHDLIDYDAIDGLAWVMTFGAKKYANHNWRGGIQWGRLYRAAIGHLIKGFFKRWTDDESGLPHFDHAMAYIMMLRRHMVDRDYAHLDDRYAGYRSPGQLMLVTTGAWYHEDHTDYYTHTNPCVKCDWADQGDGCTYDAGDCAYLEDHDGPWVKRAEHTCWTCVQRANVCNKYDHNEGREC